MTAASDATTPPNATSQIRLTVENDGDGVTDIAWEADDAAAAGVAPGPQPAQAMFLALWDAEARNALRIDLWTKQMTVEDMHDFVFQTLLTLGDTVKSATGDDDLMSELKIFARQYAERAVANQKGR